MYNHTELMESKERNVNRLGGIFITLISSLYRTQSKTRTLENNINLKTYTSLRVLSKLTLVNSQIHPFQFWYYRIFPPRSCYFYIKKNMKIESNNSHRNRIREKGTRTILKDRSLSNSIYYLHTE